MQHNCRKLEHTMEYYNLKFNKCVWSDEEEEEQDEEGVKRYSVKVLIVIIFFFKDKWNSDLKIYELI